MHRRFTVVVVALGVAALLLGMGSVVVPRAQAADHLAPTAYHLIMGNPSKAGAQDEDNYLLREQYFALSYNDAKGTPNWVSWHLSSEYLGNAPRRKRFAVDEMLPETMTRITHNDYSNSGFQRGHMCPHSDRAANQDMSYATFVMTNIVPQSAACNEGSWESLESYCRYLVDEEGKDLFIVAGPIGKGGEGEDTKTGQSVRAKTIAGGKVTVPAKVFKVIMVVEDPGDGSNPRTWVDEDTRLIAVMMPNDMSVEWDKWPQYRCSVKEVEDETGYKFFPAVHDKIKDKKLKKDTMKIVRLAKKHGRPE